MYFWHWNDLLGRVHNTELQKRKECAAVLIELYKKSVTVSCVGSDLLSEIGKWHTPQNPEWWWLYWNTMLDQIRLWADIDRNCNTFFFYLSRELAIRCEMNLETPNPQSQVKHLNVTLLENEFTWFMGILTGSSTTIKFRLPNWDWLMHIP